MHPLPWGVTAITFVRWRCSHQGRLWHRWSSGHARMRRGEAALARCRRCRCRGRGYDGRRRLLRSAGCARVPCYCGCARSPVEFRSSKGSLPRSRLRGLESAGAGPLGGAGAVAWSREGKTNRQIAARLGGTERSARTDVSNIWAKLGLTSRTQVAMWAAREGLVPPP